MAAVRQRLAPLLAEGDLPAIGVVRWPSGAVPYLGSHVGEFLVHGVD